MHAIILLLAMYTEVNLRSSWIADADLAAIAKNPAVTVLDLSHTRITDVGFRELKALRNVERVELFYAEQIGDGALVVMKDWPKLRRLSVRGTKVTDAGISQLTNHAALESLDVGFSLFTDGGFEPLTTMPNLRELYAGGNKVTDSGVNMLRSMPNLTVLDLGGVQRTDSGLWSAAVTDRGLESIASLKKLQRLNLRGAKITDAGASTLAALQALTDIDLSETALSAAGLAVLAVLPKLERVSLYNCERVDDKALAILEKLPNLRWVDLKGTKVTPAGFERLPSRVRLAGNQD